MKKDRTHPTAGPNRLYLLLIVAFVFASAFFAFIWSHTHTTSLNESNHRAAALKFFPQAAVLAINQAIESAEKSDFVHSIENVLHIQERREPIPITVSDPGIMLTDKQDTSMASQATTEVVAAEEASEANAGMRCKTHFADKCDMYQYVKFWNRRFYPEDCYESPLRPPTKDKTPWHEMKYVVFEPDRGGWNNIRMGAEVAMVFAHATGRTLVLPAPGYWYLLTQSTNVSDNLSSFEKYYDLDKIREAVTIVSMEDFLEHVAKTPGLLKQTLPKHTNVQALLKPREKVCEYLEKACYTEQWEPGKQFIGLNISAAFQPTPLGTFDLSQVKQNPRIREMIAHGRKLRPYDAQLHAERAIYFPGDYRNYFRLLTHFYTYLFWADMHQAKIYKRIVRDRLHYHDNIFCLAGYVVRRIHEDAAKLTGKPMPSLAHAEPKTGGGNTNIDATYFALHIRRGDFQYKETRIAAKDIWTNVRPMLDPNITRLIYISTDEKERNFFRPFTTDNGHFHLRFFTDYEAELRRKFHVNTNMIGMIEQVICANAHTFFGTPRSSFSGYITRMRGYYRDQRFQRTFYFIKQHMFDLQRQKRLVGPFWAREFEIAHRNADDYWQETSSTATPETTATTTAAGVSNPAPTLPSPPLRPQSISSPKASKLTVNDDDDDLPESVATRTKQAQQQQQRQHQQRQQSSVPVHPLSLPRKLVVPPAAHGTIKKRDMHALLQSKKPDFLVS